MQNTSPGEYGPRLAQYIERRLDGRSVRAFSKGRFAHTLVTEWRNGRKPSLDQIRAVADASEVTLAEVLLAMGVGRPEDFTVVAGLRPSDVRLEMAIENDPTLSDEERKLLRGMTEFFARQDRVQSDFELASRRGIPTGLADRLSMDAAGEESQE